MRTRADGHDPGGLKDLPAAETEAWRLSFAQVPARTSSKAGIFGVTWISFSVLSGDEN